MQRKKKRKLSFHLVRDSRKEEERFSLSVFASFLSSEPTHMRVSPFKHLSSSFFSRANENTKIVSADNVFFLLFPTSFHARARERARQGSPLAGKERENLGKR